jgi:glycosyltransferase involved in cell wall biosynthesis
MLAFEFAPLATGGVHRAIGFARTLPACGIELDIVTVREDDYAAWSSAPLDRSLMAAVPDSVRVHRIPSGFPSWYWALTRRRAGFRVAQYAHWGDPVSMFWRRPLLELLDRLVPERRPDVLLATAPPFGVAVLASVVARRYRLPWVVDLRDAWTRWCVAPYPSAAHYLYARTRERAVLQGANVSVATSHVTRDEWVAHTPGVDGDRLVTIYNGFDAPEPTGRAPSASGTREIMYAGSFYYSPAARAATYRPFWRRWPHQWLHYRVRREDWRYRSPYYFLRGVQRLRETRPDLAAALRVTFAGSIPTWLRPMLEETGTADVVTLTGPIPHADVLARERAADAVLLTSAKVQGARDYSIAGKTYEYFAARVPILAVLTDGAMRDLVTDSGLGILADPDDADAVAAALVRIIDAPDTRALIAPNETFVAQFDRRVIAAHMAAVLRRAAAEGYRG